MNYDLLVMDEGISSVHLGEAAEAQRLASTWGAPHDRQQFGASARNVDWHNVMHPSSNHMRLFLASSPVACGVRSPGSRWVVRVKCLALEGRVFEAPTDELGQFAAQHSHRSVLAEALDSRALSAARSDKDQGCTIYAVEPLIDGAWGLVHVLVLVHGLKVHVERQGDLPRHPWPEWCIEVVGRLAHELGILIRVQAPATQDSHTE